jgi:hypothetical protein
MPKLATYLSGTAPAKPPLPLVHGTDMYHFTSIGESGSLSPTACPFFKEDLVYLFYGRPSYRVATRSNPRRNLLYAPTCFVFRPEVATSIARVYPFDTGAFHEGLYNDYLHASMKLDDFMVGNAPDLPGQIVSAFFGDNDKYYKGQHKVLPDVHISPNEVQVYYDMIASTGATEMDDRAYTIELHSTSAISMSGNLVGVVLPAPAMDNPVIAGLVLNEWKIPFLTYHAFSKLRPIEYHGQVVEKVYELLKRGGYL